MATILDPKATALLKNGLPVDGFRIMGRLVETALQLIRTYGVRGLRPEHLPGHVQFDLQRRGSSLVRSYPEDRGLATQVAKHLRQKMRDNNFGMVDAVVKQPQSNGKEHDLLLEELGDGDGPEGLVSAEIKCRRLYSENGRDQVRLQLRKEECEECSWWLAAESASFRSAPWRGRMIILV